MKLAQNWEGNENKTKNKLEYENEIKINLDRYNIQGVLNHTLIHIKTV